MGHSFEEIDKMKLQDFGDVIGYWTEKQRADAKDSEQRRGRK